MSYTQELLFSNNATTILASPIPASGTGSTTAVLQTGTGVEFPNPSSGQAFVITLVSATNPVTNEICLCTARSGDTLTIVRAQEGTTALSWNIGDGVNMYVTAGMLSYLENLPVPFVNISAAATTDLGSSGSTNVRIVGNANITSFGTSASAQGPIYILTFAASCVLQESSALTLPGRKNIATQAGDYALAAYFGSGNWEVLSYEYAALPPPNVQPFQSVVSASTVDLGAFYTGGGGPTNVNITGSNAITSFGSSANNAIAPVYFLTFSADITLVNSSSLALPGAANIVTAANDFAIAECLGSGNWQVLSYIRAALPPPNVQPFQSVASASTVDIGDFYTGGGGPTNVSITGSNAITSLGSAANINAPIYFLTFTAGITLTNGSALALPGNANIVTQANDFAVANYLGSGNWRIESYTRAANNPDNPQPFQNITAAATTDLGTIATRKVNITGSATINSFGSSANVNYPIYDLIFAAPITINPSLGLILPSGNVPMTIQAESTARAIYFGSSIWMLVDYNSGQNSSFYSSGAFAVGGATDTVGTQGSHGFFIGPEGVVTNWTTIQLADGGTGTNNNSANWIYDKAFPNQVLSISGTNLSWPAAQTGGAQAAVLTPYGLSRTSAVLGVHNTGGAGTLCWYLVEVKGI